MTVPERFLAGLREGRGQIKNTGDLEKVAGVFYNGSR